MSSSDYVESLFSTFSLASYALRGYAFGTIPTFHGDVDPDKMETTELVVQEVGSRKLRVRIFSSTMKKPRTPIIVSVFGSGFFGRFDAMPETLGLIKSGELSVATIEHRGSKEGGTFPHAVHDVCAGVRHIRGHARQLGIDPDRVGAFGESSGAYFASMLGALPDDQRGQLGDFPHLSSRVSCVVAFYPPIQFDLMDSQHRPDFHAERHDNPYSPESLFMGYAVNERSVDHASPLTYVDSNTVPFFLAAGDSDPCVPCAQSRMLYEKLARLASHPDIHHYTEFQDAGHGGPQFGQPDFVNRIVAFYMQHL